jgi:hypothetical protein
MKRLMLLAVLYCVLPGLYASSVSPAENNYAAPTDASQRARAHFKANYANATDASWYKLDNKNSMYCIFHEGKKVERVFYNNRGSWQYTLISYPPSELDNSLKAQVLNEFESYRITYVNEIHSMFNEPVYIFNIEGPNFIKVIRMVGDEIEVKQSFDKE